MALITLDHIRALGLRAKAYTSNHLAELAGMIADGIEEIDAVKADKPQTTAVSIPATGWQEDSSEGAPYPLYYDIAAQGVTAADIALVRIVPASQPAARACGMCPSCEMREGAIRLLAASAPAEAIEAEYSILQGYIEQEGSGV